jgi:nucleotide-binding universal stress UspA family protein
MFTRILIPTNEPSGSTCAVGIGIEIATQYEATVHALYVVEKVSSIGHFDLVVERREEEGEAAVEAVEHRARKAGVSVQKAFRYRVPSDAILGYAADHDIDVIVMGTHGRSGLRRLLNAGHVAERVVREADVPVLVVESAACEQSS